MTAGTATSDRGYGATPLPSPRLANSSHTPGRGGDALGSTHTPSGAETGATKRRVCARSASRTPHSTHPRKVFISFGWKNAGLTD